MMQMYIKISILQSKVYDIFRKDAYFTIQHKGKYMNIIKLQQLIKDSGKSKVEIAKLSGITRVTLDNALQGGDIRISIVEALAKTLKVKVGYLFDEDETENNTATANNGSIAFAGNNNYGNIGCRSDEMLQERIKHLEDLLAEKERLINVYEKMMEK